MTQPWLRKETITRVVSHLFNAASNASGFPQGEVPQAVHKWTKKPQ